MKAGFIVQCWLVALLTFVGATRHADVSSMEVKSGLETYGYVDKNDDFQELAKLTAMNGNAVLASVAHENVNVAPFFRYLHRNSLSALAEEQKRLFVPCVKSIENHYFDSFALKQNKGYYVFALREILV